MSSKIFTDLKRVVRSESHCNSDPSCPPLKKMNSSEWQSTCWHQQEFLVAALGDCPYDSVQGGCVISVSVCKPVVSSNLLICCLQSCHPLWGFCHQFIFH